MLIIWIFLLQTLLLEALKGNRCDYVRVLLDQDVDIQKLNFAELYEQVGWMDFLQILMTVLPSIFFFFLQTYKMFTHILWNNVFSTQYYCSLHETIALLHLHVIQYDDISDGHGINLYNFCFMVYAFILNLLYYLLIYSNSFFISSNGCDQYKNM